MGLEPKPLTPGSLKDVAEYSDCVLPNKYRIMVELLLAAEQYWREAVKGSLLYIADDICAFCHSRINEEHKPDCPWLLAQE